MGSDITGYATYNIFNDKNVDFIKKIDIQEDILFDYREDPSYLNWVDKNNQSTLMRQYQPTTDELNKLRKDYYSAVELIVYAPNEDIAQNISNLIHGGRLLAYPDIFHNPSPKIVYDIKNNFILYENYRQNEINESMLFACLVAARSWKNKNLIYSIEKYRFSLQLDSFTPRSASPIHGQIFSVENRGYTYHVSAAYAFLSAYSIIEELGLDIRSSQKKPRFTKNDEWNSVVKEDIIKRLSGIGVKEYETINWLIRGTPSELYKSIKPKLGIKSKWNDGEIVNDQEMKIYDAIHYCSYIRNFFIGHKFDEVISYINPYDIHNVQMLVRRLILGNLDLWNFDEDAPNKYITN
ncbi:hypothetical protein [Bacillus massilinigeriensis]|uniref:hypothetical protein n=1 Tax=Bacillus massilionigeriensis TaxID=1805475 RepID=UPI00096B33D1|nr:hypothetical protein [Bacillus massilionigeriensis]